MTLYLVGGWGISRVQVVQWRSNIYLVGGANAMTWMTGNYSGLAGRTALMVVILSSCEHTATGTAQSEKEPTKEGITAKPSTNSTQGIQEKPMADSATETFVEPQIAWEMHKHGDKLRIRYSVTNPNAFSLWLVDDLVVWGQTDFVRAPQAVIVRNSDRPGIVSLYRGDMYIPSRQMRQYPRQGVRELPAKGEIKAELETPLPLVAWHYFHPKKMAPLEGRSTQAILEIQYLVNLEGNGQVVGGEISLQDGTKLRTPQLKFLDKSKMIRTDPKPLPGR